MLAVCASAALAGCNDHDANMIGLGFAIGVLVLGSIFIAFLEPWMALVKRLDLEDRAELEPETLADSLHPDCPETRR